MSGLEGDGSNDLSNGFLDEKKMGYKGMKFDKKEKRSGQAKSGG